jgi:hypothetical protein
METNWLILITGFIGLMALAVFFVIRNQKDKREFMQKLIQEDEGSNLAEPDTEVNPAD